MPAFEYDKRRAIKQTEFKPCCRCGKGVMHTGIPVFYRVTIEQMGVDAAAVHRQAGLEMVLGGNAMIANAMGPDEDMGIPIGDANCGLLCSDCAMNMDESFAAIIDALGDKEKAA